MNHESRYIPTRASMGSGPGSANCLRRRIAVLAALVAIPFALSRPAHAQETEGECVYPARVAAGYFGPTSNEQQQGAVILSSNPEGAIHPFLSAIGQNWSHTGMTRAGGYEIRHNTGTELGSGNLGFWVGGGSGIQVRVLFPVPFGMRPRAAGRSLPGLATQSVEEAFTGAHPEFYATGALALRPPYSGTGGSSLAELRNRDAGLMLDQLRARYGWSTYTDLLGKTGILPGTWCNGTYNGSCGAPSGTCPVAPASACSFSNSGFDWPGFHGWPDPIATNNLQNASMCSGTIWWAYQMSSPAWDPGYPTTSTSLDIVLYTTEVRDQGKYIAHQALFDMIANNTGGAWTEVLSQALGLFFPLAGYTVLEGVRMNIANQMVNCLGESEWNSDTNEYELGSTNWGQILCRNARFTWQNHSVGPGYTIAPDNLLPVGYAYSATSQVTAPQAVAQTGNWGMQTDASLSDVWATIGYLPATIGPCPAAPGKSADDLDPYKEMVDDGTAGLHVRTNQDADGTTYETVVLGYYDKDNKFVTLAENPQCWDPLSSDYVDCSKLVRKSPEPAAKVQLTCVDTKSLAYIDCRRPDLGSEDSGKSCYDPEQPMSFIAPDHGGIGPQDCASLSEGGVRNIVDLSKYDWGVDLNKKRFELSPKTTK